MSVLSWIPESGSRKWKVLPKTTKQKCNIGRESVSSATEQTQRNIQGRGRDTEHTHAPADGRQPSLHTSSSVYNKNISIEHKWHLLEKRQQSTIKAHGGRSGRRGGLFMELSLNEVGLEAASHSAFKTGLKKNKKQQKEEERTGERSRPWKRETRTKSPTDSQIQFIQSAAVLWFQRGGGGGFNQRQWKNIYT